MAEEEEEEEEKHYLAKYVHRSGVIRQAVRGHFRSALSNDIVFGKETSIELVVLDGNGTMQTYCEQIVYGTIGDIAVLPKTWERTDYLVVASDSTCLVLMSFSEEMRRFLPMNYVPLSGGERLTTYLRSKVVVDFSGRFIAVAALEDRFAIISPHPLNSAGSIDQTIYYPKGQQGSHISGCIWSMSFVSRNEETLARDENDCQLAMIIHRKGALLNDLYIFGCNVQENTISVISKFLEAPTFATVITEIPKLNGFALLFGTGCIYLMDYRDPKNPCWIQMITLEGSVEENNSEETSRLEVDDEAMFEAAACALLELRDKDAGKYKMDDPMSADGGYVQTKSMCRCITSFSWHQDSTSPKLIFGDSGGELFVLDIHCEVDIPRMELSNPVCRELECNVLLWIEHETFVAVVEMGDGRILRLDNGKIECIHLIQNICPILDLCVADFHYENQDQIIACCGREPQGSVRTIRNGIHVERLLKTAPAYEGITGIWALRLSEMDPYHSFLVLSFVEGTRILTVGLNMVDVTEAVGFRVDVCTLSCGLVRDGVLAQIYRTGVRVSSPSEINKEPTSASWCSHDLPINLGVVGQDLIIVATSNPCYIFLLGLVSKSGDEYVISEIKKIHLENEISCISIPKKKFTDEVGRLETSKPPGFEFGRSFLVGTHKPSLEIMSIEYQGECRVIAVGRITISKNLGYTPGGCVPESIRVVVVDKLYVLVGLRNGILLRYELPGADEVSIPMDTESPSAAVPVDLKLIAFRHVGITPVVLVPVNDSLGSDIIALSDRPWLLYAKPHGIAYVPIPFRSATHVSPLSSHASPLGILFASENSLHLVEVNDSKRRNIEKFCLDGTCRKILFHEESRTLFVLRKGQFNGSCISDICRLDVCNGSILARFSCASGEVALCMKIVKVGAEKVLVVGTCTTDEKLTLSTGEAKELVGHLIIISLDMQGSKSDTVAYDDRETEQLHVLSYLTMPGAVAAVCGYLDRYVLASAGNTLYLCGFHKGKLYRLRTLASAKTRFAINCLTAHFSRIAVGDSRDGILFYTYQEAFKLLELLYSDPYYRMVSGCALVNLNSVVVSDREGIISVLSAPTQLEDNRGPERNLIIRSSYYLGETITSIQKGSIPADDVAKAYQSWYRSPFPKEVIVCGTALGNVLSLLPLTREEYETLKLVEKRLAVDPFGLPIIRKDHARFRRNGLVLGVPRMLDGDMLSVFLELNMVDQAECLGYDKDDDWPPPDDPDSGISIIKAIQLLEQINYALS